MATKNKVWRKISTKCVNSTTGKRTTASDPEAVRQRTTSKRFYGTLKVSDGTSTQVPLTEDEASSSALLCRLQHEADRDRSLGITPADRKADQPLSVFVKKYDDVLRSRGRNDHYRKTAIGYIRDVLKDSKTTTPRKIEAAAITKTVHRYRTEGKFNGGRRRKAIPALETCNHYLRAVKAFSRWLWKSGILTEDPLRGVSLFNADIERAKVRRAMTLDELRLLVTTTETARTYGGKRWRLTGRQRSLLYVVAASTGLRASELASLKRSAFTFHEDGTASVTIHARSAKGRRTDRLPLPSSIVGTLRVVLDSLSPADHVWPGTWAEERKGGVVFGRDAKRAGIVVVNDEGESLDFHGLRTSFITSLARSGVHPATAQRLARHSTITLTMNTYTKLEDNVLREAVDKLPDVFGIAHEKLTVDRW